VVSHFLSLRILKSPVVNLILKIVAEASPREANADGVIDTTVLQFGTMFYGCSRFSGFFL